MKQLEVHYLTTFNFNFYADTPARPCAGIDVGNLKITVFYTVVMLLTGRYAANVYTCYY